MRRERLQLDVEGDVVIGDLHLPPEGTRPHPAVIVGGPMTSVKEQVTGAYARALSERGFAALALDHRHYGESGGQPRQYEHHAHKITDLRAGVEALASHPAIDADRIGAVGVCLGAGYVLRLSVDCPRIKVVGAVAGYYRDPAEMRARDPEGFQAKVDQGIAARERYEATGEVITIPAVALEGDAAMTSEDTFAYYGTRAAVPNYKNAFAVMSREHFLPFDVQAAAPRLRVPVTMIHSENALSPAWARRFHDALTVPRQLHWLASRGQTDFYDDPRLVGQASDLLATHLGAELR